MTLRINGSSKAAVPAGVHRPAMILYEIKCKLDPAIRLSSSLTLVDSYVPPQLPSVDRVVLIVLTSVALDIVMSLVGRRQA